MGEPQKKYTNDKKRGHSDCCDLFWGISTLSFPLSTLCHDTGAPGPESLRIAEDYG